MRNDKMGFTDLHTHTTYCDGRNTPEEMVEAAIERGVTTLGLLAHSYVEFDKHYAIDPTRVEDFRAEVAELREKHKDKINILFGIEADYYATEIYGGTDYVIGSCHYFKSGDKYYTIDGSRDNVIACINELFDGDPYAMAEAYFDLISGIKERVGATIVGHFDIIMKFNEARDIFDDKNERYVRAWKRAVDKLVSDGLCFEINTGAIARGRRTTPYPTDDIINYIKSKGGTLILSSDCHFKEKLAFDFEKYEYLLE